VRIGFVTVFDHSRQMLNPHKHCESQKQRSRKVASKSYLHQNPFVLLLIALGATSWLTIARVASGQVLSLKNELFVEVARSIGVPPMRIVMSHIVPNALGPIIVYAMLTVPSVILAEAFLSFLGLGVPPPASSLGVLADEGAQAIAVHPMLLAAPAVLMGVGISFVRDGQGVVTHLLERRISRDCRFRRTQ
jgi:ABC-type dipeptide/oligopeptide/nickel transport system permease subunit